jgi:hypothetical protein
MAPTDERWLIADLLVLAAAGGMQTREKVGCDDTPTIATALRAKTIRLFMPTSFFEFWVICEVNSLD